MNKNITTDSKINNYRPELDLLRGLAAVFMIVNHLIVALTSAATLDSPSFTSYLFDLASYAPVLFFFASGVGAGMQQNAKRKAFQFNSTVNKFGLLMLADLFFSLSGGTLFGLDFLGFIGISVLLLELVRCSRNPIAFSLIGIALVFVLRYVISPQIHLENNGVVSLAINWILGVGINNVSYPLSPWLTYPLLGFIFGSFWIKHTELSLQTHRVELVLTSIAIIISIIALYLHARGFSFFRWGSVSLAFYVLTFGLIFFCVSITLQLHKIWSKSSHNLLYLGGTASLAIVPIHYLIIHILATYISFSLNTIQMLIAILITTPICFLLATNAQSIATKSQRLANHTYTKPSIWALIGICAFLTYHFHDSAKTLTIVSSTLGQLLICVLFAHKPKKI